MCELCVSLVSAGTRTLEELLDIRRDRQADGEEGDTIRHTMISATAYMKSVEPRDIRANKDVQDMALALAVATERLHAMGEAGLTL